VNQVTKELRAIIKKEARARKKKAAIDKLIANEKRQRDGER